MHQLQTEHVHTRFDMANPTICVPSFSHLSLQLPPTLQDILRGTWRSTFLASFTADLLETFRWLRSLAPKPGAITGWVDHETEAGNKLDRPSWLSDWPRKLRATRPTKEKTRNQQVALLQRVVLELKSYDETRRSRTKNLTQLGPTDSVCTMLLAGIPNQGRI